jgi:hypothetical protein
LPGSFDVLLLEDAGLNWVSPHLVGLGGHHIHRDLVLLLGGLLLQLFQPAKFDTACPCSFPVLRDLSVDLGPFARVLSALLFFLGLLFALRTVYPVLS